ncbi:diguanylate cyclase (GGDEF)-like protein [Geothermobacter ehrlichii]|uniref:diguanylate cyclase n=1 Tax=Geothermobacter ehrlichii TaxID=213224 RepID=A0A5D3WIQ7_9BACT|nr:GGDEF domain-containing protein [Geothermobacter ehrlichii]TYO98118.1 diguanylate cyclase (GGDEF)-like protein [Geothermobacter ehrlichii]
MSGQSAERKLLGLGQRLIACRRREDVVEVLAKELPLLFAVARWRLWLTGLDGVLLPLDTEGEAVPKSRSVEPARLAQLAGADRPLVEAEGSPGRCWLPLPSHDRPAGLLLLERVEAFDARTLARLDDLARFLGPAIEQVETRSRLEQQNITDEVSGLYNARHFRALVEYEMERARRYGQDLSIIFFDLDHFKKVNNRYGHLVGSRVLQEIGHFLRTHTRRVNLACRYGGDEFMLLLPSASKVGALTLAEKLRKELAEHAIDFGGSGPLRITASFGVAAFPADARTPERLIQLADRAMYRVKAAGRDGVAGC